MSTRSFISGLAALVLTACTPRTTREAPPPLPLPSAFIIKLSYHSVTLPGGPVTDHTIVLQFKNDQPIWGRQTYTVWDEEKEEWECYYDPATQSWVYEHGTNPCTSPRAPTSKEDIHRGIQKGDYQPANACDPTSTCYTFL